MDIRSGIDIREELENVLDTEDDFEASFAFKQEYSAAPNPSLDIEPIGTVGLPLNQHDAMAIKSVANQAPFGKGERTVVDKSVRDTWEINASLVHFRNPNWEGFMTDIVKSACKALGVNYAASAPRCELYKLLLYETGSHFLPHVDTEKVDGMFATIIVVLPSEFTGGDAHLSHGTLSTVYNTSNGSAYQTTALAWYTDVTHEIKPITSGHRLALSYNLIHTTQSLRPALSMNKTFTDKVRAVLTAWNEHLEKGSHVPEKLLYLLDHQYSQANLRASALKGSDDRKIGLLETVANDLGFHLGLASIVCHLEGLSDDTGYSSHVDFIEVTSRHASISDFVDLNGIAIADDIEFDEESETIPSSLVEDVEAGECEDEDNEGYTGNEAGSLERWYRRTVLIIWPDAKDCNVRFGGHNFNLALKKISEPEISESIRSKILDYLLREASIDIAGVANAVSSFALSKHDLELWNRCIRACGTTNGFRQFKSQTLIEAANMFGFVNVKHSLDILFEGDSSNQRRYSVLKHLREWGMGDSTAKPWVEEKTASFLKTIAKPTHEEYMLFVELTIDYGGVGFLRESLLPQIMDQVDAVFVISLATELAKNTQLPQSEVRATVITELLISAISKTNFAASPPQNPPYVSRSFGFLNVRNTATTPEQHPVLVSIQNLVGTCYTLERQELTNLILERLADSLGNLQDSERHKRIKEVVTPTLKLLEEKRKSAGGDSPVLNLNKLLNAAIDNYFVAISSNTILSFDRLTVKTLLRALVSQGRMDILFTRVLPKLLQIPPNASGISAIFLELYGLQPQLVPPDGLSSCSIQDVISSLVDKYVTTTLAASSSQVLEALDVLVQVRAYDMALKYFKDKVFTQGASAAELLESSITSMRRHIERQGPGVLAHLCQSILLQWNKVVLGEKPSSNITGTVSSITRWTCTCAHCVKAKNFLTREPDRDLRLERIGAPARKHVEQEMNKLTKLAATHELLKTSPQGLVIIKSDQVWEHSKWNAKQYKGCAMLQILSRTKSELKVLLGEHYGGVTGVLQGTMRKYDPSQAQPVAGTSSNAAEPPAKRRKVVVDPTTIIDLT